MKELQVQLTVHCNKWAESMWGMAWTCTDNNYEPLWPVGRGKTIQEAIDSYLAQAKTFYDCQTVNYKWK